MFVEWHRATPKSEPTLGQRILYIETSAALTARYGDSGEEAEVVGATLEIVQDTLRYLADWAAGKHPAVGAEDAARLAATAMGAWGVGSSPGLFACRCLYCGRRAGR
jgi:hypothetical protein